MKKDQQSGKLTQGIVKDILTKSSSHTHGIKVRLGSGDIGRVKEIITPDQAHQYPVVESIPSAPMINHCFRVVNNEPDKIPLYKSVSA